MICTYCGQEIPAHRNPAPTVDIIIQVGQGIVLVKRRNPPFGWALPGGFVDYGETLEQAACREAKEETGLEVRQLRQFHSYSDPRRDPRHHTITTVFSAVADGLPVAGDDAAEAKFFPRDAVPQLVFDHNRILDDFFKGRPDPTTA